MSLIIHTFLFAVIKHLKKGSFSQLFCFHFDLNIINHNLNDQIGGIIIAHHKLEDQIGAIERVDICIPSVPYSL